MHILKNNKGVTLVFIALFMFMLLAFIGLAVDVGWTTYVRSQGQARVDAAALAAASQLSSSTVPATRQSNAQTIANTFAGYNMVVDTSTNPTNTLTPMQYDYSTKTLATAADWTTANCNGVKVTNAVPTPLFFSGIRNFFGGTETGSTTINVNATGYLGCIGVATPPLPLTFCRTAINYPTNCNVGNGLRVPQTGNSGFFNGPPYSNMSSAQCVDLVNGVSTMNPLGVGTNISLNNGNLTNCSGSILTKACVGGNCPVASDCPTNGNANNKDCSLTNPWCVTVPVVNACDFTQSQPVSGFAEFCITRVDNKASPKSIYGFLKCPYTFQGGTGGECFGVNATSPILVQ